MTLKEYYEDCKREEEERHAYPCCMNCGAYYTEYGYSECAIHGVPLEEEDTEKCDDWR